MKGLRNPSDIIKLVFDVVLILFKRPLEKVKKCDLKVNKQTISFIEPSWKSTVPMISDSQFLEKLVAFGDTGKDLINDETIELMLPYMDLDNFTAPIAKKASAAAEGLCTYVIAMRHYVAASKVVKPKLEALQVSMSRARCRQ